MFSVKTFHEQLLVPHTGSSKSHRIIQLENGLLVLLISDPAEDLASLSLSVAAGAHNDPDDIPGMAHFCEHLLLLGSKNFPNPNDFHDSLSKNGGRRNAFTTGESTCYSFEVPSSSTYTVDNVDEPVFKLLIEIFADCFKNPSFNESMFEKEIYAIDNEHCANKTSSGRLLYHGLRLISNEAHPFHRFATGNFFTLNDLPKFKRLKVRNHLIGYYKNNYHAERMTLVVRSSHSLNLLAKLVIQNFSDLPTSENNDPKKSKLRFFGNGNSDNSKKTPRIFKDLNEFNIMSTWNYEGEVFTPEQSQNCILINSPNNPTVRLFFPYDETLSPTMHLVVSAWCNIVGDEGEGSLDQFLKEKGLSVGLNAFPQNLSTGNSTLVIEISLTNTGIRNLIFIISTIVYSYNSQVFDDVRELGRLLFELESIDILNYLHQDANTSPMDETSRYAQTLMTNLKSLKPKNILKGSNNWDASHNLGTKEGDLFWFKRGEEMLRFVNDVFNIRNLRFAILGDLKVLNASLADVIIEKVEDTDKYFNFDFNLGKFDAGVFSSSQPSINFRFNIMRRNRFIPEYALNHLQLQNLLQDSTEKSSVAPLSFVTKNSLSSSEARCVKKTSTHEIWTKVEKSKIFESKLFVSFDVVLLDIEASPRNTMMTEIIAELFKLKIGNTLYSAELVNFTWEIQASLKGDVRFGFTLTGYNHGIHILMDIVVDTFQNLFGTGSITMDEFRKSRVSVLSRYKLLNQSSSLTTAISGLLVVLEENMWTFEDRVESLEEIDLDMLKEFLEIFDQNEKFTKVLIQGDFKDIDRTVECINRMTHFQDMVNKFNFHEPSTYLINPGKSYRIEREGARHDPTNAISFYIQTGPRNDHYTHQMTKLFSYLMALTLVPDLRFKKQLGYAVLGGTRVLRTTYGIHISIMSGTFTPNYLEDKINDYLLIWENNYVKMTEEEFTTTVVSPFVKNFTIDLTCNGGPESLTADMPSSVGSSNVDYFGESMKLHRLTKDLISTGSYKSYVGNIDKQFFSRITKADFLEFYRTKISGKENARSQISIMIRSPMTREETQQQLILLQLDAFLKMNGLRISSDKLTSIIEKTNGNPIYLLKDLFKFFISQGESFKLCSVVLKEAVKQVYESLRNHRSSYSVAGESNGNFHRSEKIENINFFHSQSFVLGSDY